MQQRRPLSSSSRPTYPNNNINNNHTNEFHPEQYSIDKGVRGRNEFNQSNRQLSDYQHNNHEQLNQGQGSRQRNNNHQNHHLHENNNNNNNNHHNDSYYQNQPESNNRSRSPSPPPSSTTSTTSSLRVSPTSTPSSRQQQQQQLNSPKQHAAFSSTIRSSNFQVVIRTRPPLHRELHNPLKAFVNIVRVERGGRGITVCEDLDGVGIRIYDIKRQKKRLLSDYDEGVYDDNEYNEDASVSSYPKTDENNAANSEQPSSSQMKPGLSNKLPGQSSTLSHPQTFTFDKVYSPSSTQKYVYDTTAHDVVSSSLSGYNATIFAYGQTGTGKTYTMEGFGISTSEDSNVGSSSHGQTAEDRGIIPRAIEHIFAHLQSYASNKVRYLVRASYLQIYNETISDLLKPLRNNLTIREDKKKGVFVEGLSEWVVRSPEEIYGLMERGGTVRVTGSTKMNKISSRSHAVFIIIIEQSETRVVGDDDDEDELIASNNNNENNQGNSNKQSNSNINSNSNNDTRVKQSFKVGKLNLVDLAGSERVRLSGATGQRLEESKKINQSLSALGNVISALTDTKGRQHIPYRDSKLTRILEDSLGGNCKTTMMAMISPALEAMVETLSTLKFANRAKNIKNEPKVNEDLDQKSLLRKYERELKKLRAELEEKNRNVVDQRRLLEIDERRKQAEADKMAAIRALEQRSLEFMKEKEEKRKLEERIAMLTNQMIRGEKDKASSRRGSREFERGGVGGGDNVDGSESEDRVRSNGSNSNAHKYETKEYHTQMKHEYETRLSELEKERETIEEEKAQVDRYKQLLLKQRDIMIALTQRLNERDEQIMALQDELDAYDKHQKELEERLDEKTAQLIHLQRVALEQHNEGMSPGGFEDNRRLADALGVWGLDSNSPMVGKNLVGKDKRDYKNEDENEEGVRVIVAGSNDSESDDSAFRTIDHDLRRALPKASISNNPPPPPSPQVGSNRIGESARILELESEVMRSRAETEKVRIEMSEIMAEKVNMEYERNDTGGDKERDDNEEALNEEITRLNMQNIELTKANQAYQNELKASSSSQQNGQEQDKLRLTTLTKERSLIKTIMESKIKVLVNSAYTSAQLLQKHTNNKQSRVVEEEEEGEEGGDGSVNNLMKDIVALKRLVQAAVKALGNSEKEGREGERR